MVYLILLWTYLFAVLFLMFVCNLLHNSSIIASFTSVKAALLLNAIYWNTNVNTLFAHKQSCNATFIEIRHRHGCSPVNLLHCFKTPFPKNNSGGAASGYRWRKMGCFCKSHSSNCAVNIWIHLRNDCLLSPPNISMLVCLDSKQYLVRTSSC